MTPGLTPTCLIRELDQRREHVLRTVDGLSEEDLDRAVAPSGWTPRWMLNHLLYDDEIFWVQAVLAGDRSAINRISTGRTPPLRTGPELRAAYRREAARNSSILKQVNLDDPPAWRPPSEVFSGPLLSTGWDVILRVLSETSIHAGHLDMAREAIDGHQELVIT